MSLLIIPRKTKLEASFKDSSKVNILLKDVYNNTVFTDSNSEISAEIYKDSKNIITTKTLTKKLKK
jgi:hypothetical protein